MRSPRNPVASFVAPLLLAAALTACGGNDHSLVGAASAATSSPVATTTSTMLAATTAPSTTAPVTTAAATTAAPVTSLVSAAATAPPTSALPTPSAPITASPATTAPASDDDPNAGIAPPPAANAVEPIRSLGTIEIPSIGVSKTFYEGVSLGVLDHGPGHWPGTAAPGQAGNMVIAGHRMSHDHPFRDLDKLQPGDAVIFTDTTGTYTYHVTSTEVVTPTTLQILDQTSAATATLFACHPKGSTRQRIVVHLELASTA